MRWGAPIMYQRFSVNITRGVLRDQACKSELLWLQFGLFGKMNYNYSLVFIGRNQWQCKWSTMLFWLQQLVAQRKAVKFQINTMSLGSVLKYLQYRNFPMHAEKAYWTNCHSLLTFWRASCVNANNDCLAYMSCKTWRLHSEWLMQYIFSI